PGHLLVAVGVGAFATGSVLFLDVLQLQVKRLFGHHWWLLSADLLDRPHAEPARLRRLIAATGVSCGGRSGPPHPPSATACFFAPGSNFSPVPAGTGEKLPWDTSR